MRKLTVILLPVLFCLSTNAQVTTSLFTQRTELSRNFHSVASKYEALQLNSENLSQLKSQSPAEFTMSLPFENGELQLELKKVKITSDNFSVIEALPGGSRREVVYNDASFYQGKIRGASFSMATISIVGNQVMGVIADDKSNIILGAIEQSGQATEEYVLYRQTDLAVSAPRSCFTSDEAIATDGPAITHAQPRGEVVGDPVDIYFECDYKMYQDRGSNTISVINYVLGFFNSTVALYANENIKIQVSQILVWTTQDPEAAAGLNSSNSVLTAFSTRMSTATYIGDYAHFLSTRSLGGGIAWLTGTCPTKYYRSSTSAIYTTYSNFPTYSWTVEVVTHELGHNLGSHHTHWCGWPGGPIDGCGPTANIGYAEGTCATGPIPFATAGSIMSYCHLLGAVGINFNNGFGPLPGQAIRDFVSSSSCIGTCKMTIDLSKIDASCGQNNGSATVAVSNATGSITYLWSNGQTGATLVNAAPGTYHVTVKDAAGCQVMEDVVIGNSGTSLSFSLNPVANAGFCAGGSITLTATNNPSYTYLWRRNGALINGAISYSYTASTAGTYSVTATSGVCIGTLSTVVTQVAAPTANITPATATTFCEGDNVVLDAGIGNNYSYQWYSNGVAINGATSASYTAVASGNYSVKVAAGNACEATSTAVPVTVNASPLVNITVTGTTSFCSGSSVQLTASSGTGYSYQWYKDGVPVAGATQSVYQATTAGSYTEVSQLGSCSKTSGATAVAVLPSPVITITPLVSTIEKFESQVLTGSGAASYNWSSHPDMVSSTASTAEYRPLTTTAYPIEGTAGNGCKTTVTATIKVIGCGDVSDIKATPYSPSRVLVQWKNPLDVVSDTLQYRKVGATAWNKVYVENVQEYELNGLEPGTSYEYSVIPLCTTSTVYIPSPANAFTTQSLEGKVYVRLFPNPALQTSRLEVISADTYSLSATVYDQSGKLVMTILSSKNMPGGQTITPVNVDNLASGIYHILVTINGKKQDIKMAVVR